MSRLNVLSGQIHGKVDWITQGGREIGMFLRTSDRDSTRCVLRGPEVERLLSNGLVQKGSMVTAYGDLSARCMQRNDDGSWMAEVLCTAARVVAETALEGRVRGSIYANLKGVVMHWDLSNLQVKTFFNPKDTGCPEQVTCSIYLRNWLGGMSEEGQQRFKAMIRSGREFTSSALVEVSSYRSIKDGAQIPSLMLLPTDFKLQG